MEIHVKLSKSNASMIPASPGFPSSVMEEHFAGVVVNDACELQWVFISSSCHHLQDLSETNTDIRLLAWKRIVPLIQL